MGIGNSSATPTFCDECKKEASERWFNDGLTRCYYCNRNYLILKRITLNPTTTDDLVIHFVDRYRESEIKGVMADAINRNIVVKTGASLYTVSGSYRSTQELIRGALSGPNVQRAPVILPPPIRPDWIASWMRIAHIIADRSYDPRLKVGAIIVSSDNTQMLSVGYNGNYKGGPNQHESTEPGASGFIHAEINALLKCDFNFPKKKHMYVTHSPCRMCSKCIVNGGIATVFYDHPYRDTSGLDLLREAGVEVFSTSEAR